jgi:hypothetical protein
MVSPELGMSSELGSIPLASPSPFATTYCEKPSGAPSSAHYIRPVSIMSIMRAVPIRRGMRHRATAADEYAVHALGEGVIRTAFGHPDMRGGRQFQAAADDRTVQYDDHWDLTVFDLLESAVPGT